MTWFLFFVCVFLFFFTWWKTLDLMFNRAAALRAEKRAQAHFETAERLRRSIG